VEASVRKATIIEEHLSELQHSFYRFRRGSTEWRGQNYRWRPERSYHSVEMSVAVKHCKIIEAQDSLMFRAWSIYVS